MNKELLNVLERERTEQIISSVRNGMFSAKSTMDSHHDIEQFRNSSSNTKFQLYLDTRKKVEQFDHDLTECMNRPSTGTLFEEIVALCNGVQKGYADELHRLYRHEANSQLTEVDISTHSILIVNFLLATKPWFGPSKIISSKRVRLPILQNYPDSFVSRI